MKSHYFPVIIAITITLLAIGWFLTKVYDGSMQTPQNTTPSTIKVEIKGKFYNLEVADTKEKRTKGLMNRTSLDKDGGMIFIFGNSSIYPFWMKNTLISLDIIWLDKDKKVVYIKENAQPCETTFQAVCGTIIPNKMAKYVVELNAGEVEVLGLKENDSIEFKVD